MKDWVDEQAAMDVADDVLIAAHAAGDLLLATTYSPTCTRWTISR
jgi:hypothetical protein